ncbi:MAG: DUF6183 family protein [Actinobacteria bacterium]|nr:DUF6183 family protein [Actinomycetota bacterium]MCI0545063.1 DUF6183 family protein [Actinomycetota bacterium]MCI0678732.1 DUF6183 family protein [Actinomycetota bacterium]
MTDRSVLEAIEASDTDELIRVVDRLCRRVDWPGLVDLRERCAEALIRGRQLWGVDEHIRYRLALEAPGRWAGPVVTEGPARFTLGPLTEVAASTKTWAELDPFLGPGPERSWVAAERVLRGESGMGEVTDLPDRLLTWEPVYPLATYKSDRIETPAPPLPAVAPLELPQGFVTVTDPESEAALADLVTPWTNESNGRCQVVTVEGPVGAALRALGLGRCRVGPLPAPDALRWMCWAGASGGAHGRRRGAAAGRYGAWWVVATLSDLGWPPHPDETGDAVNRLTWSWFDDGAPGTGWQLRLAVEDPVSGLAWAVSAIDSAD